MAPPPAAPAAAVCVRRSDASPRVRRGASAAVREALRGADARAAPHDKDDDEDATPLQLLADGVARRLPRDGAAGGTHVNVLVSRADVAVHIAYARGSLVR